MIKPSHPVKVQKFYMMTCFLFYLNNISGNYFDNFFEVTYEIEKNVLPSQMLQCISKMGYMLKMIEKDCTR